MKRITAIVFAAFVLTGGFFAFSTEEAWADDPPGGQWYTLPGTSYQIYYYNQSDYEYWTGGQGNLFIKADNLILRGSLGQNNMHLLETVNIQAQVNNLTLQDCSLLGVIEINSAQDFTLTIQGNTSVAPLPRIVGGLQPPSRAIHFRNPSNQLTIKNESSTPFSITSPNRAIYSQGSLSLEGPGSFIFDSGSWETPVPNCVEAAGDITLSDTEIQITSHTGSAISSENGMIKVDNGTVDVKKASTFAEAATGINLENAQILEAYDADDSLLQDVTAIEHEGRFYLGSGTRIAATGAVVPSGITTDGQAFSYYLVSDSVSARADFGSGAYITGRKSGGPIDMTVPSVIKGMVVVSVRVDHDLRVVNANLEATKPNLRGVWLRGNLQMKELFFDGYTQLETLEVSENIMMGELRIRDASSLTFLNCFNSGLTHLELSGNLSSLEEVNCMDNELASLNLSYVPNMKMLDCQGNNLVTLDVSKSLQLENLNARRNSLEGVILADASEQTNLGTIELSNNRLASLDISKCPALLDVYLTDNLLESIDLTRNTKIAELYVNGNRLTSLGMSSLTQLQSLYCQDNRNAAGQSLTQLNLAPFRDTLFELDCSNNDLSALDVQGFTQLSLLKCAGNALTSLKVADCIELAELDCSNNKLTELILDNCPDLVAANCSGNEIATLSYVGCSKLRNLNCSDNKLSELQIDDLSALRILRCGNNYLYDTSALEAWGFIQGNLLELGTQNELPLTMVSDENGSGLAVSGRFGFAIEPRLAAIPLDPSSAEYQGLLHGDPVLIAASITLDGTLYGPAELYVPAANHEGQMARLYSYTSSNKVEGQSIQVTGGQAIFRLPDGRALLIEVEKSLEPISPDEPGVKPEKPGVIAKVGDSSAADIFVGLVVAGMAVIAVSIARRRIKYA